jgi:hypothetical protein
MAYGEEPRSESVDESTKLGLQDRSSLLAQANHRQHRGKGRTPMRGVR